MLRSFTPPTVDVPESAKQPPSSPAFSSCSTEAPISPQLSHDEGLVGPGFLQQIFPKEVDTWLDEAPLERSHHEHAFVKVQTPSSTAVPEAFPDFLATALFETSSSSSPAAVASAAAPPQAGEACTGVRFRPWGYGLLVLLAFTLVAVAWVFVGFSVFVFSVAFSLVRNLAVFLLGLLPRLTRRPRGVPSKLR
mmetsp:Transcript_5048/g.12372  ORF Transcript_5048/g.12372 Transcript_5048/m.12372 type:complete len:193 (-) Transcript_5048:147-725(-)